MNKGEKIKAAKAVKAEAFAKQHIKVDDWEVRRVDDMNWELLFKGKFKGYYGRLLDALRALPHKMLHVEARDSLQQIYGCLSAILACVERSL